LATILLAELESASEFPELYWLVTDALCDPNDVAVEALRDRARLAPVARSKVALNWPLE